MMRRSSNFAFLELVDQPSARIGLLAERAFADDPPGVLIRLRQLAEHVSREVAARHGVTPTDISFDAALTSLRARDIMPRQVADLAYHLKRVGNAAVHENVGTRGEALQALKIARELALWFARTYGGGAAIKSGPFVPPQVSAVGDYLFDGNYILVAEDGGFSTSRIGALLIG